MTNGHIFFFFYCPTIPSNEEIVTKGIFLSQEKPFNFALLLIFTYGINVLFLIFLGILKDLFSTLLTSSYCISDEGLFR